jgi:hypothetical protein
MTKFDTLRLALTIAQLSLAAVALLGTGLFVLVRHRKVVTASTLRQLWVVAAIGVVVAGVAKALLLG